MCNVCGCGHPDGPGVTIESAGHGAHGHDHLHAHDHDGSGARLVRLEQDLLAKNDRFAAANRARFEAHGVLALNLVSSPGSGKTTLLAQTVAALRPGLPVGVIEGDQQTSRDADRIREAGVPAVQINTGKACHLDAHMVGHALERLGELDGGVLFVENVGNLVCPAGFDLGEAHKVVVVSVTEGEDKPLKYGPMFAAAGLMLINKIDLLPYVEFDVRRCIDYARRVNPEIEAMEVSATTGAGMADWLAWIERERRPVARQPVLEAGD